MRLSVLSGSLLVVALAGASCDSAKRDDPVRVPPAPDAPPPAPGESVGEMRPVDPLASPPTPAEPEVVYSPPPRPAEPAPEPVAPPPPAEVVAPPPEAPEVTDLALYPAYIEVIERLDPRQKPTVVGNYDNAGELRLDTDNVRSFRIDRAILGAPIDRPLIVRIDGQNLEWRSMTRELELSRSQSGTWNVRLRAPGRGAPQP